MTRWSAFVTANCFGAKIESPEELLLLPGEGEMTKAEKEEDVKQLRKLLEEAREHNKKIEKQ